MSKLKITCFKSPTRSFFCNVRDGSAVKFSVYVDVIDNDFFCYAHKLEHDNKDIQISVEEFIEVAKKVYAKSDAHEQVFERTCYEKLINEFGDSRFPIKQTFIVNSLSFDTIEEAEKYRAELIEVLKIEELAKKHKISVDKVKALREDFKSI